MQIGVTKTKTAYFMVLNTHGMVIDNINLDKELWKSIKINFEMFYKDFYLNSSFFKSKGIM